MFGAVMPRTRSRGVPVRSSLAVPGSNRHMMEKSLTLEADEVFFDLEDAVAPSAKAKSRASVAELLAELGPVPHVQAVRVNGVGSGTIHKDIVEILEVGAQWLDRIIVPKVRCVADVVLVDGLLTEVEAALGLEESVGIELLIESASAAVNCAKIAAASSRVVGLIFGGGDYSADLGIERSTDFGVDRDATLWAKSAVVNTAAAVMVTPLDGPFPGLRDEIGFREACARGRRMGFRGKWCVHPAQIRWCNEEFGVSEEEVESARALLATYAEAVNEGRGAISYDGRLVDEATRKHAQRTIETADAMRRRRGGNEA